MPFVGVGFLSCHEKSVSCRGPERERGAHLQGRHGSGIATWACASSPSAATSVVPTGEFVLEVRRLPELLSPEARPDASYFGPMFFRLDFTDLLLVFCWRNAHLQDMPFNFPAVGRQN